MASFSAILYPTDFSPASKPALGVARSLARTHGARLVIVHVVRDEHVPGVVNEAWNELVAARAELDQLRDQVDGPDLKLGTETHLRRGRVASEILDAADEISCDLIVMGSHGRSALGRVVFGSVAEAVLRKATCPVIIVRESRPVASADARSIAVETAKT